MQLPSAETQNGRVLNVRSSQGSIQSQAPLRACLDHAMMLWSSLLPHPGPRPEPLNRVGTTLQNQSRQTRRLIIHATTTCFQPRLLVLLVLPRPRLLLLLLLRRQRRLTSATWTVTSTTVTKGSRRGYHAKDLDVGTDGVAAACGNAPTTANPNPHESRFLVCKRNTRRIPNRSFVVDC